MLVKKVKGEGGNETHSWDTCSQTVNMTHLTVTLILQSDYCREINLLLTPQPKLKNQRNCLLYT